MLLNYIHNPRAEGQGEYGIAQKSENDVDGKPVTLQDGGEGKNLFGQSYCRNYQNQCKGRNKRAQHLNPISPVKGQVNPYDGPCKKREGFMEIGNGGMPSLEIPKYESDTMKGKPGRQGNEGDFGQ